MLRVDREASTRRIVLQIRSIVAEIAGDHGAPERVKLVLPETRVCSRPLTESSADAGCCGGPPYRMRHRRGSFPSGTRQLLHSNHHRQTILS